LCVNHIHHFVDSLLLLLLAFSAESLAEARGCREGRGLRTGASFAYTCCLSPEFVIESAIVPHIGSSVLYHSTHSPPPPTCFAFVTCVIVSSSSVCSLQPAENSQRLLFLLSSLLLLMLLLMLLFVKSPQNRCIEDARFHVHTDCVLEADVCMCTVFN